MIIGDPMFYIFLFGFMGFICYRLAYGRHYISALRTSELIENGAIVIDMRTKEEYNKAHADAAINIPLLDLSEKQMTKLNLSQTYIFYDNNGYWSKLAAFAMRDMGYQNIYYTYGKYAA